MSQQSVLDEIPADFNGRWAVVSSQTPDGEQVGGEVLDYWDWTRTTIESSDWHLTVKSVTADVEEHQDMHLIDFTNNLQFAVLRAESQPEVILVIQYGNGEELTRCLLTQQA
ncbi:hypothetical protein SAMN06265222_12441 [Neorhodopirellula lusitana]|uniref:Lipocalin-like domain-containing protein n=1 Tax=Neorhodopirellula lusitana TaxID=445327 RepID=A0ABY1QU67_9BACT|nr:hypothetical protein [Neorhodopirellula lusitana]SMP78061.1 hypothetical protein SAMN06265222_12441 [Neorhodopirellula lusitana]